MNRSSFLSSFILEPSFHMMDTYPSYNFLSLGSFPLKDKVQQKTKPLPFPWIAHKFFASWAFLKEATDGCISHTCYSYCNRPQFYFPPMLFPQNCSSFAKLGDCLIKKQCPWFRNGPKEIMYWLSQQWNTGVVFQSLEVVGKGALIQWGMFFWLTGCR